MTIDENPPAKKGRLSIREAIVFTSCICIGLATMRYGVFTTSTRPDDAGAIFTLGLVWMVGSLGALIGKIWAGTVQGAVYGFVYIWFVIIACLGLSAIGVAILDRY
jgi:hypothetical protein